MISRNEHLLAVRLKAEMPRLDDAGVHRADRDLVHLVALDPEERVARRGRTALRAPAGRR